LQCEAALHLACYGQGGAVHTVRGFDAVKGYNLASGLGTVDAALIVPELVAATHSD